MIRIVSRDQLEEKKYDTCILNAKESRIYAFSWYLDIVADNWDVLVLDDYKAVMPLPWRTKYFIKYIYIPCWVQQLGLFHENAIDDELIEDFFDKIPNKFKKITHHVNMINSRCENSTVRNNFILSLEESYEDIRRKYKKNRKYALKKVERENCIHIEEITIKDIIDLFKDNYQNKKKINLDDYEKLQNLVNVLSEKRQVEVLGVFNENSKLISGAVFLKDTRRITYLFSASSLEGKKQESSSLLIDSIIEKNSLSDLVFDFEGSMIPGVASFFKSFGADLELYFQFNKTRMV